MTSNASINVFSMKSQISFKGFIKNGLDSSMSINLIVSCDSNFDDFRKRGLTFPPHLFYYHEISVPETIGVLINKYKFTKNEANEALSKLVKEFNLEKIERRDADENFEKIVEDANARLVEREKNPRLKISRPDVIIIGGFLREKINFVHTLDKGFEKTCLELKINVLPVPERDFKKEKEIKKWMKKRR